MEDSNSIIHSGSGGVREMIAIALPMIVSSGCDTMMMFTDRLFLSRLGPEYMSAGMGGGMTAFMLLSFFVGLLGYSTAVTAKYFGAGKPEKCPSVTYQSFLISLFAFPFLIAFMPLMHMYFRASGIAEEQLIHQLPYFDILMYGCFLGLLRSVFIGFFSGIGQTKVIMLSSVAALVTNAIASYLLVFGKFGFPELGISGAAYGTLIGSVVMNGVMAYAFIRYNRRMKISLRKAAVYDRPMLTEIVKFGFPAGMEMFLAMTAFTLIIFMFHSKGIETASAVTIAFNWDHVAYVPLIGLEISVTSLFGRYLGAGRPDIAHRALKSGLKTGTLYSVLVSVLFVFFPVMLINIFHPAGPDASFDGVRDLAVYMLRTASIYVIVETLIVVYAGALRGAGDTYWAMFINVGIMWILVGIAYIGMNVYGISIKAAWLIMVLMFLAIPAVMYLRYRYGGWEKRAVTLSS